MLKHKTKIRVRYCEVDRMGYLHHGNYAAYFEIGRTDLLREYGLSYRELEDSGIILPVRNLEVKYVNPVHYDDEIILNTFLSEIKGVRLIFNYEVLNLENTLCCEAKTTLVFADAKTGKPIRIPSVFNDILNLLEKNILHLK